MGMRFFNKLPVWFITFVFFFFSVFIPASSSECQDGTYKHDGRDCCLCGAGQYLVKHCSTNQTYGECMPCEAGETYRDQPNAEKTCEPCTSCTQENANLEVAETCTTARNSKCKCKTDHYCIKDGTDVCKLCYPCNKCDAEGIKEACTGYSNSVCNDKIEGGTQGGMIAGIIVTIIVIIIACIGGFLWKRRREGKRQDPESNGRTNDVEIQPLKGVDILPHRSDIAEVIGWKVMKDLAVRSGMGDTVIDNCQQNHPHDAQEQTVELLKLWGERQGAGASEELLNMLRRTSKKDKYEKVKNILAPGP